MPMFSSNKHLRKNGSKLQFNLRIMKKIRIRSIYVVIIEKNSKVYFLIYVKNHARKE